MKNKLILLFLFLLNFNNSVSAQTFNFETKNLEIADNGNVIYADEGIAFTSDKDLEIQAERFEYKKDLGILKTFKNGKILIRSKNLEIEFDESIINQKNSTISAYGNVKIIQTNTGLKIETDKISFNQLNNTINSAAKTKIIDNLKNIYEIDNFSYQIDKNLLKLVNLKFQDLENNNFTTSLAFINTKTNRLFGKDVSLNLNNKSFNKNNEPRLKGNSIINDDESTEITKGIFTTCKRRDGCPPWQLSAEKIEHDKKNKVINYKNALLKVYDVPVMYFPKFFHPDPTVKRRSGFLIPTIKNSPSSDNYLNIPYFFAIAGNKDATFSPRLYAKEKILFQTEYRQVNSDSNHISDFSLFSEKNNNSKSHFFYNYDKNLELQNFSDGTLNFKVQKVSNDTYLKTNKIKTSLISDNNVLENSFGFNLYSNNLSIDMETTIYEDLDKNNNDRYEYILPKIDLVKNINNRTKLNGNFSFKSQNLIRNYNTNILEKININDLIFSSYPKISKLGFYNNYEFLIKNSNTDSQNSNNYKKNENFYLTSLFQYNSSLPLIKENKGYLKIFKPKFALKVAPTHTKEDKDRTSRIDANNIYSLKRATDNDSTEGGVSLTYGSEYSVTDKEKSQEIFSLKLANNLRFEENDDLPKKNQIGQKTSNFFSEISYTPNRYLTTKYSNTLKNNFSDINYENLIAEFKINNFVTTFDYLNENNTVDKNSYITNTTEYSLNESNNLSFSTRENKTSNLTEYYNLMYQYKNDCLAASVEYNKEYYTDRDLKPSENIFLKLTIIPFGETSSPNLKN